MSYGGDRWLLSYSTDVFDDWVVVVLMPMTITAADTYRMLNYTMLAVGLLVGSILALLLFSLHLFYRRERAREQAAQREKLELEVVRRTAESKNQFLAKMSHDIRTPLSAIIGLLQIVKGMVTGQPKVEENLFQVEQSAEYLKNLFQPFEQESPVVARTHAGSGLGLSIVKNLVELMGGEITVASAKGQGSRFEVSLQLAKAEASESLETACEEALSKISLEGRKLLLAEDNELNAMIARELITTQCARRVRRDFDGWTGGHGGYPAVGLPQGRNHPHHRHVGKRLCRRYGPFIGARDERPPVQTHRYGKTGTDPENLH